MSSSSSTLHPLAASHPLSIPIFSTNHSNSLSLPLISFNFTLSYNPRKAALVACVEKNETVEVTEDEVRWENEESDIEESDEQVLVEEEEEEAEAFSEEAKVFVGNLSYEVDSEQLAEIFGRAGAVEIAEVIYNRETNQSRGFAFVTMSTVQEAEKAVELFNRYDVNGRLLTVSKAAPKGEARPERITRVFDTVPRIYVGNLPWTIDDERLEQIFNEHGKVVEARIVYDSETGRSRGFGFVTLSTENEVQNAIGALDGQSLEGRSIRVNVAETRPARRF